MGQYYLGYVNRNGKQKVFDNRVDGSWCGLKLMEHSYWKNSYVGNVVNDLFYNKGQVVWCGDYYDESDYYQINCSNKELVKSIGELVWGETIKTKTTRKKVRYLNDCLIVNHTKKVFIICNEYYAFNKWIERWNSKNYEMCVHPLPLLTCSANHSGGSYYGTDKEQCGSWYNDVIEIVLDLEIDKLEQKGYHNVMFEFREN